MLLAQVDRSREPAIKKTRAFNRAALATPSSIKRAHRLLQHSAMKQVGVPLRASTLSSVFKLPATIPELPPTTKRVASPVFELSASIPELPPTIERVAGGEHVVKGGVAVNKMGSQFHKMI